MAPVRTLYLWCPDWPVIAAGLLDGAPVHEPVAVLAANRVIACSPAARSEGIRVGLRKREAQGRCPHVVVVEHDPARDARAFEPVVLAVEEVAPGVEVVRPGACALAARGPARYHGSEEKAAELLVEQVGAQAGVEAQVGIADGVFAAGLAARLGRVVPPGRTPHFLAGMDVAALDRPALVDLLRRLGVTTLGGFAALPAGDVLARFGLDAALAHRLAAGRDDHPLAVRQPPADLSVAERFDPPLERVDAAAFAARALAERLQDRLLGHGLATTRLLVEAVTGNGEELRRTWRHDGLLDATGIADRVRWQLDGWLTHRHARPTAGLVELRLVPDGVVAHAGMQPGLWGEAGEERDRAHRALTRIQGLLGPDAVVTAVRQGGRGPADRVGFVPWGDQWVPQRSPDLPWPGRIPAPSPATVFPRPLPAAVLDGDGTRVGVTARLELTGQPARLAVGAAEPVEVVGWAGPWPVDERWWAPGEARRLVRFQVALAGGHALLLVLESGQWYVEALYD